MSFALQLPWALAALAALAVPLLVHLARRGEAPRTVFPALRWLRAQPLPRRRPRLEDWLLLALRLLLVALAALWLARPVLLCVASKTPWVAVLPGVAADAARGAIGSAQAEAHWLAPGFPPLAAAAPAGPLPFASLLRELDAHLPPGVPLTLIVPERLEGADAQRPRLGREVEWKIVAGAMPAAPATAQRLPAVTVCADDPADPQLPWLRAVFAAWQVPGDLPVGRCSGGGAPKPGDLLIWRSRESWPPDLEPVPVWRDAQGRTLVEAAKWERGRVLRFARDLVPSAMPELLEPDFPARLREVVQPPTAPATVLARDYAPQAGRAIAEPAPRDLRPELALAIALVFLAERGLAVRGRRAAQS